MGQARLIIAYLALALAGCEETSRRPLDGGADDGPVLDCPQVTITSKCADGWCRVPAGCFVMGSPSDELCHEGDEIQHEVQLTRPYEIDATEVTQEEFQQQMGYNPAKATSCGVRCPVENVSWHEAAAYCNALSAAKTLTTCYSCTGSGATVICTAVKGATFYDCPGYRLPTEAEWERAYRAGTTDALYNGPVKECTKADTNADAIAWYAGNATGSPHAVGRRQQNPLGLYDMAGNVWEWVNDWYSELDGRSAIDPTGSKVGFSRTVRGGSFTSTANKIRAAHRTQHTAGYQSDEHGFRCVRSLP